MVQRKYNWLYNYIAPGSDILPPEPVVLTSVGHHREEDTIHYEEMC